MMQYLTLNSDMTMFAVLPELDQEGWTSDDFVRDMPVDYTLLVENLLDPGQLFFEQTRSQMMHCSVVG